MTQNIPGIDKSLLKRLGDKIAAMQPIYYSVFPGRTGRLDSSGNPEPNPCQDLPPGFIWVRATFNDQTTESRAAVPAIIAGVRSDLTDAPIWAGYNANSPGASLVAISVRANQETVNQFGDHLAGIGVANTPPAAQNNPIRSDLLQGGRTVLPGSGGGLNLYVEPYTPALWVGGYIPVDPADVPTNPNEFRWLIVIFPNGGGTPTYVTTTPVVTVSPTTLLISYALATSLPAGSRRAFATTLGYAQTDINSVTSVTVDLRDWFVPEGALLTGSAVARTIAAGVLTLGVESVVIVSPSSGTTATLNTITLTDAPRELWLYAAAGCTITIADAADNLFVSTGSNLEFTELHVAHLYHNGTDGFVLGGSGGGDATTVTYTPTTPSDWPVVPSDVQEALDTLAGEAATGGINKDLFTQTATVTVASTTTPTTLLGAGQGSSLIAANYFTVGRTLVLDFAGIRSTALAAPTILFEIDLGSTAICLTATITDVGSLSGQQFHGHVEITCITTGASGTVSAQGWVSLNSTSTVAIRAEMVASNPVTLDTTISQQVKALVTWGTSSASNTISATQARLQTVDPNVGTGGGTSLQSDRKSLASGDITMSSTTFIDLSSSLDITLTTGAHRCLVSWTLTVVPGSGQSQVDVQIDGTLVSGATFGLIEVGGAAANRNLSGSFLSDVLTAASHTFKLYARIDGGTNATYRASSGSTPIIHSVVELYT